MEENQVRTYFTKLDIHKLTDSGGMHSRALKKLLGHSIIFDWPWWPEVPEDWRKTGVTPIFKKGKNEDLGNCRPLSLTLIPGKMVELNLEIISRHMKGQKTSGVVSTDYFCSAPGVREQCCPESTDISRLWLRPSAYAFRKVFSPKYWFSFDF